MKFRRLLGVDWSLCMREILLRSGYGTRAFCSNRSHVCYREHSSRPVTVYRVLPFEPAGLLRLLTSVVYRWRRVVKNNISRNHAHNPLVAGSSPSRPTKRPAASAAHFFIKSGIFQKMQSGVYYNLSHAMKRMSSLR